MTITCERLDDLLFEGDAASMRAAEEHARTCRSCRTALDAWNDLSATAPALQHSWTNELLVPRAMQAIRSGRNAGSGPRGWQVAAMLLLAVVLGGTVVWVLSRRAHEAEFDRSILRISAIEEVERAERTHLAAIRQLEAAAEPKLEHAADPVMVSYNEKLMLLDEAIAECETAIESNRQNAHLRRQLLAMLSEKRTTLQEVVREDTNVPAN